MQHDEAHADDLLARALLDAEDSAAVALKVQNLPLADALTVIFHGRRDLGTIQTYVTHGGRGAGSGGRAPEPAGRPLHPPPPPGRGPCPAPSTPPRPAPARRPRSSTPSRPARCATRSSPPTPSCRSGASRS